MHHNFSGMDHNPVGWFEIPVLDMERAMAWYERVFITKLERHEMPEIDMAWFPQSDTAKGAAGSLVKSGEFYKPSHDGSLVYFTAPDLDDAVKRAEEGGKVLVPKKAIGEYGWICIVEDSEGNRIGLHALKA